MDFFTTWRHSSFVEILRFLRGVSTDIQENSILDLTFLKDWFGNEQAYLELHQESLEFLQERWLLE